MKLPWWLEPMGTPPASSSDSDSPPMTRLNPPPAPTTLTWIVDRRPTAADAHRGSVEVLLESDEVGIGRWQDAVSGCWKHFPWAHCPGWSEPEVLVPSDRELGPWVAEFAKGNAAGDSDCSSNVLFIATRTAEWIAKQRKRGQ